MTIKTTAMKQISLNEEFNDLLEDLQPGIIKHHGRQFAYHVFLTFKKDKAEEAREWIATELADRIISAKQQLLDTQAHKIDRTFNGRPIVVCALSSAGYKKLGETKKMPIEKGGAFKQGMKRRKLNDNIDIWEKGLAKEQDCIIIIADSVELTAEKIVKQIKNETSEFATINYVQRGEILRNEHGVGIEHFGYADGISQPIYLKDEIDVENTQLWSDQADAFESLLVKDPGGSLKNSKRLTDNSYGSFLVFRKLEQDVFKFKRDEHKLSKLFNDELGIKDRYGNPNGELAGAMLVGRFEDGTAVITDSDETGIKDEKQLNNDFTYQTTDHIIDPKAENRCPFHSHIRLTNDRKKESKPNRITRRGIPFNDCKRDVDDQENDQPREKVGLLFMCYQKDIASQFEAIQINANNHFDAIIGQTVKPTDPPSRPASNPNSLPCQWGQSNDATMDEGGLIVPAKKVVVGFPGHVTNRGGEYFFTPSISFLKSLSPKP